MSVCRLLYDYVWGNTNINNVPVFTPLKLADLASKLYHDISRKSAIVIFWIIEKKPEVLLILAGNSISTSL